MRGSALETLARKSVERQADQGLHLIQTGPRFVGRVGSKGEASGRLVALGALDFIGDYRGRFVTFDAKSCANATSFPLADLRRHQVVIVKRTVARGGLAFFLLEFTAGSPSYWALTWDVLRPYWNEADAGGRQSIPRAAIEGQCLRIQRTRSGLDLVGVIEQLQAAA